MRNINELSFQNLVSDVKSCERSRRAFPRAPLQDAIGQIKPYGFKQLSNLLLEQSSEFKEPNSELKAIAQDYTAYTFSENQIELMSFLNLQPGDHNLRFTFPYGAKSSMFGPEERSRFAVDHAALAKISHKNGLAIAAGNIIINTKTKEIKAITNKTGHYKFEFSTLLIVLQDIVNNGKKYGYKFSEDVVIVDEQTKKGFKIKGAVLEKFISVQPNLSKTLQLFNRIMENEKTIQHATVSSPIVENPFAHVDKSLSKNDYSTAVGYLVMMCEDNTAKITVRQQAYQRLRKIEIPKTYHLKSREYCVSEISRIVEEYASSFNTMDNFKNDIATCVESGDTRQLGRIRQSFDASGLSHKREHRQSFGQTFIEADTLFSTRHRQRRNRDAIDVSQSVENGSNKKGCCSIM